MKIINMKRGTGKTNSLIKTAFVTGYPIIVPTVARKAYIENLAKRDNLGKIAVYTLNEWKTGIWRGRYFDSILIDDLDDVIGNILKEYFGAEVVAATLTSEVHGVRPEE